MYCRKCGNKVPDDSLFCQICGGKIEKEEEQTENDIREGNIEEDVKEVPPEKNEEEALNDVEETEEDVREKQTQATEEIETKDRVYDKLCALESLFLERIAYDEHKNELFDKLYEDKKRYENDVIASVTDPILMDLIQVIEEVRAQIAKLPSEATQENYDKLIKKYKDLPLRLEDVLYEYDVEPYEVEGDIPDMKLQKVVHAIETTDEEAAGKVAARLTVGYKKGNRVIKSERINVYKVTREDK